MSSTETEPAAAEATAAASTSPPPVEEQAAASKVQQPSKPSTPLEKEEEEDTIKPAEPAAEKVEEDQPVETDTVKGTPEVSGEDRLGKFICQTFRNIGYSSTCQILAMGLLWMDLAT